jgi:microsomal dipeptidase-like Zn-dependent dipeptidase
VERWSAVDVRASSSLISGARHHSSPDASRRLPSASRLACKAPRGARAYLSDLYYDTGLSNSAEGLACITEVTEIEHVVFGTDWPYAALPDGDPAPALDMFGAPTRRRIESAHAQALVPRLTAKLARTEHDN